jgi:hypothetical protein
MKHRPDCPLSDPDIACNPQVRCACCRRITSQREDNGMVTTTTEYLPKESCHNCRYGGQYTCKRHAPVANVNNKDNPDEAIWPSIYNNGCGTWCGDYERSHSV